MFFTQSPSYAETAVGTETILHNYFGVNLHMDNCCKGNYSDVDEIIARLEYIGARRVRDWATKDDVIDAWLKIHSATGAKFHVSIPQTSPENQRVALARIDRWLKKYPDLIDVIEGSNEPDTHYPASQGASLEDSADFQSDVYSVGKKHNVPVAQLSVGGGWKAPFYEGNYKEFGKPPADFGNAHVYMNPNAPPSSTLKRIGDLAAYSVGGKPVDITEFGTYKSKKHDEDSVNAFMHIAPFSSYLLGNVGLFVYALNDDMSGVISFYDDKGNPRPFADYWHNTTKLLSDKNGKNLPAKEIDISFTNQNYKGKAPLGIKNVLMYKSDGSIWIATYDEERPETDSGSQTIQFDKLYKSVTIFDGRDGRIVKQYRDVGSVDVEFPINQLYLIKISDK